MGTRGIQYRDRNEKKERSIDNYQHLESNIQVKNIHKIRHNGERIWDVAIHSITENEYSLILSYIFSSCTKIAMPSCINNI